MLNHAAEDSFSRGMDAWRTGNRLEALAMFEAAIELERRLGVKSIQARYLSWYGLCLTLERRRSHDGIYFCREATAKERYNPDLHYNLARACMAAGRRREANDAIDAGLQLHPEHVGILKLRTDLGTRRRPVLPFLSRDNGLNVLLGKLTHGGGRRS